VSRTARPVLVCVLLLAFSLFASGGRGDGVPYLVGAHYYVWYPDNFASGYLRGALRPPQRPALGEYDSRHPAVAERHIALAVSHGIDFFTVDWWPNRPEQNAAIESGFLRAANVGDIRFCIFYESTDLDVSATAPGIAFDTATKARFVTDSMTIARRYFGHPSYLRIDGRPVLLLYVTREMYGLLPQAMREMRQAMAAEGYDPFVIGDEIFWAVVEAREDPAAAARITGEPQLARIRLFDAITAYNLYMEGRPKHSGYGSKSNFLPDSVKLYRRYRDASAVPIIPDVIPGFNDRAVRPAPEHFVIPRRWTPHAAEGSFFAQAIERIGKPFVDERPHAILITSWNEWNEDTAIEPLVPSQPTAEDASGQRLFTQGYVYQGFGDAYLDVVRDHLRH
jgi:glycoprotein endo-alpha-1,2-mannosidase